MLLHEIFYSTFWISAISVIWFYTDWIIQYGQLLGVAEQIRLDYTSFIVENPNKFFPDFLYEQAIQTNNTELKFFGKLVSCPFCLILWLSIGFSVMHSNLIIIAPIYVLSLLIVLQIKRMI